MLLNVYTLEPGWEAVTQPSIPGTILPKNPSRDELRAGTALTMLTALTSFISFIVSHFYNTSF